MQPEGKPELQSTGHNARPSRLTARRGCGCLIAIAVVLLLAVALLPVDPRSSTRAFPKYLCRSHLANCKRALAMYRTDHGAFPTALALLSPYVQAPDEAACPSSEGRTLGAGYAYRRPKVTGKLEPMVWDSAIRHRWCICRKKEHRGKCFNVLLENGAIISVRSGQSLRALIAEAAKKAEKEGKTDY